MDELMNRPMSEQMDELENGQMLIDAFDRMSPDETMRTRMLNNIFEAYEAIASEASVSQVATHEAAVQKAAVVLPATLAPSASIQSSTRQPVRRQPVHRKKKRFSLARYAMPIAACLILAVLMPTAFPQFLQEIDKRVSNPFLGFLLEHQVRDSDVRETAIDESALASEIINSGSSAGTEDLSQLGAQEATDNSMNGIVADLNESYFAGIVPPEASLVSPSEPGPPSEGPKSEEELAATSTDIGASFADGDGGSDPGAAQGLLAAESPVLNDRIPSRFIFIGLSCAFCLAALIVALFGLRAWRLTRKDYEQ